MFFPPSLITSRGTLIKIVIFLVKVLEKKLDPLAVSVSEKLDHYHNLFQREAYCENRMHIKPEFIKVVFSF